MPTRRHASWWRRRVQLDAVRPDINVTPLVDVVLVLLIIFMVVTPALQQDVPLDLPGVFNPDPESQNAIDPIKVSVPRPGDYRLDGERFDLDGLTRELIDRHMSEPERRLVLRGDQKLPYADVRAVMARLHQIGFPGINFMVGERHRGGGDEPDAEPAAEG
jgi:biopolymer transport protein ExbD/biopolymer transport protein TolR